MTQNMLYLDPGNMYGRQFLVMAFIYLWFQLFYFQLMGWHDFGAHFASCGGCNASPSIRGCCSQGLITSLASALRGVGWNASKPVEEGQESVGQTAGSYHLEWFNARPVGRQTAMRTTTTIALYYKKWPPFTLLWFIREKSEKLFLPSNGHF